MKKLILILSILGLTAMGCVVKEEDNSAEKAAAAAVVASSSTDSADTSSTADAYADDAVTSATDSTEETMAETTMTSTTGQAISFSGIAVSCFYKGYFIAGGTGRWSGTYTNSINYSVTLTSYVATATASECQPTSLLVVTDGNADVDGDGTADKALNVSLTSTPTLTSSSASGSENVTNEKVTSTLTSVSGTIKSSIKITRSSKTYNIKTNLTVTDIKRTRVCNVTKSNDAQTSTEIYTYSSCTYSNVGGTITGTVLINDKTYNINRTYAGPGST